MAEIMGVDVGGSGIKAAIVDTDTGEFIKDRKKLDTPRPSKPEAMALVVKELATHFDWHGKIGVGFPTVVKNGICYTAANIHKSWIGANIEGVFGTATGCLVKALNDADAAGMAEMKFGAGKGIDNGVVLVLTLGTGIGSAIFVNGQLLPNLELGHLEMGGKDAEKQASANVKETKKLTWKEWGKRVNDYLKMVENLIYPDLIILGGGVSSRYAKYQQFINIRTRIVPAELMNNAGIIGAALAALE
ncbi:MAG: polyphosphate glucokinase [Anaerolinea sp.]|nr:polyphosphate glucokinase [Anaerolinea sp.]